MYTPIEFPGGQNEHANIIGKNSVELGVVKSFEFVSQLRRASVIARHFGSKSGDIFVKGAPEAMKEICRPETCKLPR